jgi:riboflavin transporter FmnP
MNRTKKIILSGLFLALCMILPFITGQIPQVGNMLSPMHIPVLLCGFICGPLWGGIIGFIAPALRFLIFGAPPIMPIGISMMFELATYGIVAGLLYKKNRGKKIAIYFNLILAMIGGRVIWGSVMQILSMQIGFDFTWEIYAMQAFVTALPGIIVHILLIPPIIILMEKRIQNYDG